MHWDGGSLFVDIDEIAFPLVKRVRGRVRVTPQCLPGQEFALDCSGTQLWQPIAPIARIDVTLASPALVWSGHAYFDHNRGSRPLENAFRRWDWSRQATPNGTRVLYDMTERDGSGQPLAIEIGADGSIAHREMPAAAGLPRGPIWRMSRGTRCDADANARVLDTLEDTPFYARSVVETSLWGDASPSMHESLDLDRFASPIVQAMLPFRMPRRAG